MMTRKLNNYQIHKKAELYSRLSYAIGEDNLKAEMNKYVCGKSAEDISKKLIRRLSIYLMWLLILVTPTCVIMNYGTSDEPTSFLMSIMFVFTLGIALFLVCYLKPSSSSSKFRPSGDKEYDALKYIELEYYNKDNEKSYNWSRNTFKIILAAITVNLFVLLERAALEGWIKPYIGDIFNSILCLIPLSIITLPLMLINGDFK